MDDASLRRFVYALLLVVTAGMCVARIIGVELVYEPSIAVRSWPKERPEKMPTFSSNDRSRWATIRALVENGTFVVGKREVNASSRRGGITPRASGNKTADDVSRRRESRLRTVTDRSITC